MTDLQNLDLTSFLPEILLVAGTLVLTILELMRRKSSSATGIGWGGMILLAALMIVALAY